MPFNYTALRQPPCKLPVRIWIACNVKAALAAYNSIGSGLVQNVLWIAAKAVCICNVAAKESSKPNEVADLRARLKKPDVNAFIVQCTQQAEES